MSKGGKNLRKLSSPIFGSHTALKKALFSTLIPTVGMFLVAFYLMKNFEISLKTEFALLYVNDSELMAMVLDRYKQLISILFISFAGLGLLGFYIAINVSNRLIGPITPIERLIKDLIAGQTGKKIQLRKGDLLEDMSGLLNELSEKLDEKK